MGEAGSLLGIELVRLIDSSIFLWYLSNTLFSLVACLVGGTSLVLMTGLLFCLSWLYISSSSSYSKPSISCCSKPPLANLGGPVAPLAAPAPPNLFLNIG